MAPRSGARGRRGRALPRHLPASSPPRRIWSVGVVVPEEYYISATSAQLRDRFVWTFVLARGPRSSSLAGEAGAERSSGAASLGWRIVESTASMRRLDFSPRQSADAPVRELALVAESVERAKTSLRALGKYAPIELVRRLYERNQEPQLGGEPMEVSMLFTDIEGFTTLSGEARAGRARRGARRLPRGDVRRHPVDRRSDRQVHRRRGDGVLERPRPAARSRAQRLPGRSSRAWRRRASSTRRRHGRGCRRSSPATACTARASSWATSARPIASTTRCSATR